MVLRGIPIALTAVTLSFVAMDLQPPVAAQKRGKPTSQPATGLFRCPGFECPAANPTSVPPVLTDAITGDYADLPFAQGDGSTLDTVGEYSLRLVPNGRFLSLDFSIGSAPCGAGCRRNFTTINLDAANLTLVHTNVIDPATGDVAGNGMLSIPVGETWPSRLKLAFNTTGPNGENIAWAVRFNPYYYYPSDHVSVVRTSTASWEIFATDAQRAMLVSTCCRQKGNTNEGLYVMPFRMKVSTP